MPEGLTPIIVAIIGLTGALVAAYMGYRQWRQTRRDSTQSDMIKARRQAYEELWRLVEKVHIDLRLDPRNIKKLPGQVKEVNTFIIQNEPHLSPGDHQLVNDYLVALKELVKWAHHAEAEPALRENIQDTGPIPRCIPAANKAFRLRDELLSRTRAAISGT